MVGWYHRLNGHEFEQTPGESEGQGILVCYNPWGRKQSDMTYQLNNATNCLQFTTITNKDTVIIFAYLCECSYRIYCPNYNARNVCKFMLLPDISKFPPQTVIILIYTPAHNPLSAWNVMF